LTEYDLRERIRTACIAKIDRWCWLAYHFPLEKKVWVEDCERQSELDYLLFTYETNNKEEITVSEPQEVKLIVSIAEVNDKFAELTDNLEKAEKKVENFDGLNSKVNEQAEALVSANATIQELNSEIANLTTYKEKLEEAEQAKIAQELAAKQSELKDYALESGYIIEAELDADNEKANQEIIASIDKVDRAAINIIIAERFMQSQQESKASKNSKNDNKEIASVKVDFKSSLEAEELPDYKKFIKSYLGE